MTLNGFRTTTGVPEKEPDIDDIATEINNASLEKLSQYLLEGITANERNLAVEIDNGFETVIVNPIDLLYNENLSRKKFGRALALINSDFESEKRQLFFRIENSNIDRSLIVSGLLESEEGYKFVNNALTDSEFETRLEKSIVNSELTNNASLILERFARLSKDKFNFSSQTAVVTAFNNAIDDTNIVFNLFNNKTSLKNLIVRFERGEDILLNIVNDEDAMNILKNSQHRVLLNELRFVSTIETSDRALRQFLIGPFSESYNNFQSIDDAFSDTTLRNKIRNNSDVFDFILHSSLLTGKLSLSYTGIDTSNYENLRTIIADDAALSSIVESREASSIVLSNIVEPVSMFNDRFNLKNARIEKIDNIFLSSSYRQKILNDDIVKKLIKKSASDDLIFNLLVASLHSNSFNFPYALRDLFYEKPIDELIRSKSFRKHISNSDSLFSLMCNSEALLGKYIIAKINASGSDLFFDLSEYDSIDDVSNDGVFMNSLLSNTELANDYLSNEINLGKQLGLFGDFSALDDKESIDDIVSDSSSIDTVKNSDAFSVVQVSSYGIAKFCLGYTEGYNPSDFNSLNEILDNDELRSAILSTDARYEIISYSEIAIGKFISKEMGLNSNNFDTVSDISTKKESVQLLKNSAEALDIFFENRVSMGKQLLLLSKSIDVSEYSSILSRKDSTTISTFDTDEFLSFSYSNKSLTDVLADSNEREFLFSNLNDFITNSSFAIAKIVIDILDLNQDNYKTLSSISQDSDVISQIISNEEASNIFFQNRVSLGRQLGIIGGFTSADALNDMSSVFTNETAVSDIESSNIVLNLIGSSAIATAKFIAVEGGYNPDDYNSISSFVTDMIDNTVSLANFTASNAFFRNSVNLGLQLSRIGNFSSTIGLNTIDEIVNNSVAKSDVLNGKKTKALVISSPEAINAFGLSVSASTSTAETYIADIDNTEYLVHRFRNSGQIVFTETSFNLDALIIGGGGGGGTGMGGGGGAGGVVETSLTPTSKTEVVTVGAGGSNQSTNAFDPGSDTQAFGITAIGGGGGGSLNMERNENILGGQDGGSGGGAGGADNNQSSGYEGGEALQPASTDGGFGSVGGETNNNGGDNYPAGGGGGALEKGQSPANSNSDGGDGGDGYQTNIDGNNYYWAGGGGGGGYDSNVGGDGGLGGGGGGSAGNGGGIGGGQAINAGEDGLSNPAGNAGANTGGGGGGSRWQFSEPGKGGSGIVIVRYEV